MYYFAYGSNMLIRRITARVPSARVIGPACLTGHRLAWHKISKDGSGKCDIPSDPGGTVWGVLFEIDPQEKHHLDAAEGLGFGYGEKRIGVALNGEKIQATTYQATHIDASLLPYHWNKEFVLAGAREHGLPPDYLGSIERACSIEDPNPIRRRKNEAILAQVD